MSESTREDFPTLLERLYRERFTGETLFCWQHGVPKVVKFVKTTEIRLASEPKDAHDTLLEL